MRVSKPENVKRCVHCGAKKQVRKSKKGDYFAMFHKPDCKLFLAKEAEQRYPGIEHGTYLTGFML